MSSADIIPSDGAALCLACDSTTVCSTMKPPEMSSGGSHFTNQQSVDMNQFGQRLGRASNDKQHGVTAAAVYPNVDRTCCKRRCSAGIGTSGFQAKSSRRRSACAAASPSAPLTSPAPPCPLLLAAVSWPRVPAAAASEPPSFVLALADGRKVAGFTATTAPFVACPSTAATPSLQHAGTSY